MVSRLRSWWQKTSKPRLVLIVTSLVILLVLLIGGYFFNWTWTGFGAYTLPNSSFQREKTLYDWLQLAIIPVALAVGVWWLNRLQQQRDQKLADQRAQTEREAAEKRSDTEREIALDNQHEAALQDYIDKMSALLLENDLSSPVELEKVRKIGRVRTLTVLPRLDGKRKRNLLLFLYDADLINGNHQIIKVSDADLCEADLSGVNLYRTKQIRDNSHEMEGAMWSRVSANLKGVNLRKANLNGANLRKVKFGAGLEFELDLSDAEHSTEGTIIANLSEAKLVKADLCNADLGGVDFRRADLCEATLCGAYLQRTNLSLANLHGADLGIETLLEEEGPPYDTLDISDWKGANLSEANLRGANLSDANLWKANLRGADLRGADLKGTDLRGADLVDAKVTDKQLAEAKSLEGTTMPDGTKHD